MKGKVLFREKQTFRYTWSWWLILVIAIPLIAFLAQGLYQQLVLGEIWGDKPMSNTGLIITNLFTSITLLIVFLLFNYMSLTVEIDAGYIRYQFWPFQATKKQLAKQDVTKLYVRSYSAITEYGGWGYRTGLVHGKALNVSGKWGLQLELSNGKKLLLGTQKPEVMEAAVEALKTNWNI